MSESTHDELSLENLPGGDGSEPIDFSTYVLSMTASCLVQLGDCAGPDGQMQPDLVMARHTLEILSMLEERTEGNLRGDECRMLSSALLDLKQRYIAKFTRG